MRTAIREPKQKVTLDQIQKNVTVDTKGCWLWIRAIHKKTGYGIIRIPGQSGALLHRVVWKLVNGKIPNKLCVCHKCDVRNCCNPDHLFLGTQKENVQDAVDKGRWKTKLTKVQAREIRNSGEYLAVLAARFGVGQTIIHSIKHDRIKSYL